LACPSDPSVRVARNFSNSPAGFFNPGLRNNAVSYFIGLDTYVTSPYFQLTTASGGLAGDRNLQVDAVNVACSSGVTLAAMVLGSQSRTRWTNTVHGVIGNVLAVDGQVAQTSNSRVVQAIAPLVADNGSFHLLLPR